MLYPNFEALPYALGENAKAPDRHARMRVFAEDFKVDEISEISPDGEGEHIFLQVQKTGCNTEWLARQFARFVGIRVADVSYAGLKDRHAVTTQWFSLHLPGKAQPDWSSWDVPNTRILQHARHCRKLRRGMLAGNRFELILRDLTGTREIIEQTLLRIRETGVPNYFGEQRFGFEENNLQQAEQVFLGKLKPRRHQRGLYISAARSFLFNQVLAQRIREQNWLQMLPGEVLQLSGSRSWFVSDSAEQDDTQLMQRLDSGDVQPTGPLWGKGESPAQLEAGKLEQDCLAPFSEFCQGLEKAGLKQERRPLRLPVADLSWSFEDDNQLKLNFTLPAGSYATVVIREIVQIKKDDTSQNG
ncbi:tRNA pseudouridine(13) synthase TruD [Candidatus Venteria ishoeyi]|uniref:tRNA pseudouridine(13) synthase TruD n=1 Tax=Candidatus Venteria ishoeyi TaxID=1899563 RepID=UPI0025A52D15|nr:tRNA pseudouridine(13) synthase TruD [Candidatus Venteria ishoeyi]MDM8545310.1 tRNA pseudouridine(13) synthase TruD [Candidatus Venteria ishoeyi]